MESLQDLHEFRKQNTYKTVEETDDGYFFKPVKNRPSTPALSLRQLMDLIQHLRLPKVLHHPLCLHPDILPPVPQVPANLLQRRDNGDDYHCGENFLAYMQQQ
jgi:hypothetical protein